MEGTGPDFGYYRAIFAWFSRNKIWLENDTKRAIRLRSWSRCVDIVPVRELEHLLMAMVVFWDIWTVLEAAGKYSRVCDGQERE
jgi:hypothetical protein